MFGDSEERTPLLQDQFPTGPYSTQENEENLSDAYQQFCFLVGNSPADQPSSKSKYKPPRDTLYHRALSQRKHQSTIYALTRALTNTLLLAQVVLGAALTGLGATDSPGWLITIFGAANTIIAGIVTFLKSRGQPMRARMFRDDLSRVVDEIENSATMWRGISQKVHGYDAIDTDDAVTVRSEVARLTRLYDRAVKTNTMNDPDHYGSGISVDNAQRGLRARTGGQPFQPQVPAMGETPAVGIAAPAPIAVATGPATDPDESPATHIELVSPPPPSKEAEQMKASPVAAGPSSGVVEPGAEEPKPLISNDSAPPPQQLASSPDLEESPVTSIKTAKGKDKSEEQTSGIGPVSGASNSS
jgi:hypothetical protein